MKERLSAWGLGCWLLIGVSGCCALPGDPTCDLQSEWYGQPYIREFAYCPDLSLEGLNETDWYCCPLCWNPECGLTHVCGKDRAPAQRTYERVFATPTPAPVR